MSDKEKDSGLTAKMLAEYVNAIVCHIEDAPGGQSLDDVSKASILKAASNIYEVKYQRECVLAAVVRGLQNV